MERAEVTFSARGNPMTQGRVQVNENQAEFPIPSQPALKTCLAEPLCQISLQFGSTL
jgi:hypothetical protein